jgi:hypothetical protein
MFSNGSAATLGRASLSPTKLAGVPLRASHPAATIPQIANATTPPRIAFRQVKSWRSASTSAPEAGGRATSGPATSPSASDVGGPTPCMTAVASTTGRPMIRRKRANGGAQSGRLRAPARVSTTWRTSQLPTT